MIEKITFSASEKGSLQEIELEMGGVSRLCKKNNVQEEFLQQEKKKTSVLIPFHVTWPALRIEYVRMKIFLDF